MELSTRTIDILKHLHQFNVDLVVAYGHAIEKIVNQNLQANLGQFKLDHLSKLRDLEVLLGRYDIEAPKRSIDTKGVLMDMVSIFRSYFGDRQILHTLHNLEAQSFDKYKQAVGQIITEDRNLHGILRQALMDEREHLDFFLNQLGSNFNGQNTTMPHSSRKVS